MKSLGLILISSAIFNCVLKNVAYGYYLETGNKANFGIDVTGTAFSNGEIGFGFNMIYSQRQRSTFFFGPTLVSNGNSMRLGGTFSWVSCLAQDCKGKGVFPYGKFGIQYVELKDKFGRFQPSVLLVQGMGINISTIDDFWIFIGTGYELIGPFVQRPSYFSGIVSLSWGINDLRFK